MNKSLIFALLFNLLFFNLSAQVNIEGQVFFNNEPLENVTIFLNNTTTGTTTNNNGEFSLELKNGFYQLIISHVGFKTIKYDFDASTYTKPLAFHLSEEEYVLGEVVVYGTQNDDDWKYNFSVFFREFIGTSEFSQFCTILNPEVLFFEFDAQNNILTAEASEPLHIKNEALGYDIYYDLEHFSVNKKVTNYSGYSYFEELEGRKNKQKKWQKNRLKAYNGSPLHFFRSLLKNTTEKEGFIINQFARKKNEEIPSQEEIAKARKLLTSSNAPINFSGNVDAPKNATDSALMILRKAKLPKYIDYLYKSNLTPSDIIHRQDNRSYLQFDDNLRVTYLKEKEEEGYILRNVFSEPRKALPQTSNIIPFAKRFIIYPEGVLENPLDLMYEEYWSYEKLAHSLPLDYEPT